MYSVRGAITIEDDTESHMLSGVDELLRKILEKNNININEIISIIFSCTKDLTSVYPAKAARDLGIINAGLLCLQEMYVEESMKKCIRLLMHVNGDKSQSEVKHIFLRDAVKLRLDIKQEFDEKY